MMTNDDIVCFLSRIPLPEYMPVNRELQEADYYGATCLIAKKCNILHLPYSSAGWRHGWIHTPLKYKEQLTVWGTSFSYLVATKEDQLFLKSKGIKSTAVGMPFVYADSIDESLRLNNSLLVMPMHSLPYTLESGEEELYIREIEKIRDDFSVVVFCIHHACYEKGIWPSLLNKYNFPYIIGASAYQKNAFIRLQKIFSSFEFVTTNTIGSHIPYAAYCGAKVSIYGHYKEYSINDFKNDPFYHAYPQIYVHNFKYCEERHVREMYGFLFTKHPKDAILEVAWASCQLGASNRKTEKEIAELLGWNNILIQILYRLFYLLKNITRRLLPKVNFRKWILLCHHNLKIR